jgi:2-hydroxy-3-keto-5-methylthiopentenyl-1-phosphate phosphatase
MSEQENQLADLIMAIIQNKVDERIEQKVNDLQDGVNTVAFDIQEHRDEIVAFVEEDMDIDDQVRNFFYNNTMSVSVD